MFIGEIIRESVMFLGVPNVQPGILAIALASTIKEPTQIATMQSETSRQSPQRIGMEGFKQQKVEC